MNSATVQETAKSDAPRFQARAGNHFGVGRTMGEALDALIAEENGKADSSLVLLQRFQPDEFFGAEQIQRLQDLMARRETLNGPEEKEMEALIKAELVASAKRSAAILKAMGK